jgi:hypothetical protein
MRRHRRSACPPSVRRRVAAFTAEPVADEAPESIDGAEVIAREKVAFYPVTLDRKRPAPLRRDQS